MADESVDLNFLARQGKQILTELAQMREQTKLIPKLAADVSELQVTVAAIRADQGRTNELLEQVHKTQANHGARLNAIDGRLAIIEERTGLVKA
jgi:hypothetical protein